MTAAYFQPNPGRRVSTVSQIGCVGDHRGNGAVVSPWCTPTVFGWQCVDRYQTGEMGFVVGWAAYSGVMVVGLPM